MTRAQIEARLAVLRRVERERADNLLAVQAQIAEREWELRELEKAEAQVAAAKIAAELEQAESKEGTEQGGGERGENP